MLVADPGHLHPAQEAHLVAGGQVVDEGDPLAVLSTAIRQVIASIRQVASSYLDGNRLTEPLLNQVEVAIRAYDPCLSCATHAMGKMPLEITLVNENDEVIDRIEKRASGQIQRTVD